MGSTRGRNVGSSVFFAHRGNQIDNGEAKYYVRIRRPNYRKTEKDREKSRRTIPIPPTCLTALRHHKARQAEEKLVFGKSYQDYGLVFSRPDGRPIAPTEFSRHFGRLLKRAGLPRIKLHDARHTYATTMLELGEGPKVVQSMLGHSSVSVTLDIYSHVSLALEQRAASRLDAALTGGK